MLRNERDYSCVRFFQPNNLAVEYSATSQTAITPIKQNLVSSYLIKSSTFGKQAMLVGKHYVKLFAGLWN